MDPLGLKRAKAARDKQADDAISGAVNEHPAVKKGADEVDFFKPGPPDTPEAKARKGSRLAKLLKDRDAEKAKFADAWNESE